MDIVATAALLGALSLLTLAAWRGLNPACPTCHGRRWDRRLCRPLLLCRRCAQRIDRRGNRHN